MLGDVHVERKLKSAGSREREAVVHAGYDSESRNFGRVFNEFRFSVGSAKDTHGLSDFLHAREEVAGGVLGGHVVVYTHVAHSDGDSVLEGDVCFVEAIQFVTLPTGRGETLRTLLTTFYLIRILACFCKFSFAQSG